VDLRATIKDSKIIGSKIKNKSLVYDSFIDLSIINSSEIYESGIRNCNIDSTNCYKSFLYKSTFSKTIIYRSVIKNSEIHNATIENSLLKNIKTDKPIFILKGIWENNLPEHFEIPELLNVFCVNYGNGEMSIDCRLWKVNFVLKHYKLINKISNISDGALRETLDRIKEWQ
jgi:hypothetical protein